MFVNGLIFFIFVSNI